MEKKMLYIPILQAISEGCDEKNKIQARVIEIFDISDQEMKELSKSQKSGGKRTKFDGYYYNALYQLRKDGFLVEGKYELTKKGEEKLNKNSNYKPIVSCVEEKMTEHNSQSLEETKNITPQVQQSFDEEKLKQLLKEKRELLFSTLSQFAGNEYNVRAQIIDPILDFLGWTFPKHRHNEVVCHRKDDKGNKYGCRADYALHNSKGYQIVIEAKSIDKNLFEQKYVNQLKSYLDGTKKFIQSIGILTNGYEWYLFNHDCNEIIFHTNIESDDFTKFARMIEYQEDKDYIEQKMNRSTCYSGEVLYPKGDALVIKHEDAIENEVKKKYGTKSLHDFVKRLLKEKQKTHFIDGSFDKIIITEDPEEFQRDLSGEKPDYENLFITRDHDLNFKYLVIRQLIYQNEEYRGKWSVEYRDKDK